MNTTQRSLCMTNVFLWFVARTWGYYFLRRAGNRLDGRQHRGAPHEGYPARRTSQLVGIRDLVGNETCEPQGEHGEDSHSGTLLPRVVHCFPRPSKAKDWTNECSSLMSSCLDWLTVRCRYEWIPVSGGILTRLYDLFYFTTFNRIKVT